MFYPTILKSVGKNGAVDVTGRPLTFIGDLPVEAGDTVWTDGRVIFGNAPPKNIYKPVIQDNGVPVLGDNLRGYVNKQGKYKKTNIVKDAWIINDDKNFKHGDDVSKVIDIEIEKDFEDDEKTPAVYSVKLHTSNFIIYRDSKFLSRTDYEQFNLADKYVREQMRSFINEDQDRYFYYGPSSLFLPELNYTQVLGVKTDRNGNWDAIIASWSSTNIGANNHVYRNALHNYIEVDEDYSKSEKELDWKAKLLGLTEKEYQDTLDYLHSLGGAFREVTMELLQAVNIAIPISSAFASLRIARYLVTERQKISFKEVKPPDYWKFASKNQRSVLNMSAYYLAHVRNGEVVEIIDRDVFQTFYDCYDEHLEISKINDEELLRETSVTVGTYDRAALEGMISVEWQSVSDNFKPMPVYLYRKKISSEGKLEKNINNTFKFPLQDGYYAEMNLWQIKAIYSENNEKICGELPVQNPQAFKLSPVAFETEQGIDTNKNVISKTFANGAEILQKANPNYSFKNLNVCGFFDKDRAITPEYRMPNVSVTKLSKKKYLIGFHGGNLYLAEDGNIKKLTKSSNDNLKNFRLRGMKNLKNAKAKGGDL